MIHISAAAQREFHRQLARQATPINTLRLGVATGGCIAWRYTFTYEMTSSTQSGDLQFKQQDFTLIVAEHLMPWLDGLSIDYSEDLMGGNFRFSNPNVVKSCGCGISFSLDATDAEETIQDCLESLASSPKH